MAGRQIPLRGNAGFDANGNKLINLASPSDPTDGLNLDYFVKNNSVQDYDDTVDYPAEFIVNYKDVLYISKRDIIVGDPTPDEYVDYPSDDPLSNPWAKIRTTRQWIDVKQKSSYYTDVGKFYAVDSSEDTTQIVLPSVYARNIVKGDIVTVKDGAGNSREFPIQVTTTDTGASISGVGESYYIVTNNDEVAFVFDGFDWNIEREYNFIDTLIKSSDTDNTNYHNLYSFEHLLTVISSDVYLNLPPNPNINDVVRIDTIQRNIANDRDLIIKVDDSSTHQIDRGNLSTDTSLVTNFKFNPKGVIALVYSNTDVWTMYNEEFDQQIELISSSKTILGVPVNIIDTESNTSDITITIPNDLTHDDFLTFSNIYGNENCNITITSSPNGSRSNTFKGDLNSYVMQKYSDVSTNTGNIVNSPTIVLDGSIGFTVTLRYLIDNTGDAQFYIENINIRSDVADYQYNERPALMKLATDVDAIQQTYLPDGKNEVRYDDRAITPHTLDNRRATDTLAGLGRIATSDEVLIDTATNSGLDTTSIPIGNGGQWSATGGTDLESQFQYDGSGGTHRDDILITPLKLAQRTATDTRTGMLETATFAQSLAQRDYVIGPTDVMDNIGIPLHTKIITPDTLDARRASETQTGLARLATFDELLTGSSSGNVELIINPDKFQQWADRDTNIDIQTISGLYNVGVGISNAYSDGAFDISAVGTDVTLWDGITFSIAMANEKQRGTLEVANYDEANIQINNANATGVVNVGTPSDEHIITPAKLDARRATIDQTGLIRLATNDEVDAGTLSNEVALNPASFKYWLDKGDHIAVDTIDTSTSSNNTSSDGLTITGSLWTGIELNIKSATETQRGTARFATTLETSNQAGGYSDLMVSVKDLDSRRSTETQTGIARIATQNEVDLGVLDGVSRGEEALITPLKLKTKFDRASNFTVQETDGLFIDTGDTLWGGINLSMASATETQRGTLEVATQTESNAQSSALDDKIITPNKLNARRATETLSGLSYIATQVDVDAGTLDTESFITPLKLKTWLDKNTNLTGTADAGVVITNTLWSGANVDIQPATETQRGTLSVASQVETNAQSGAIDDKIITPNKLNARRATETLSGLASIATTTDIEDTTNDEKIVTPLKLSQWISTTKAEASTTNKGFVELSTNDEAWFGTGYTDSIESDVVAGNEVGANIYTPASSTYSSSLAVTPSNLNNALSNYLPRHAIADDSWQLGGRSATEYNDDIDNIKLQLASAVIDNGQAVSVEFTDYIKVGDMTIRSADGVGTFVFD